MSDKQFSKLYFHIKMKPLSNVFFFSFCMFFGIFPLAAQELQVSAGTLQRFPDFASQFVTARNIDVWLPDGYTSQKKYAVLYMHDGQMLYDASSTWNKQAWEVDTVMSRLLKEKKLRDCIVVGVWNGGVKRHCEYFPQKPFEALPKKIQDSLYAFKRDNKNPLFAEKVQSDQYLKFLVKELKPFIDKKFSTKKDQKNTFIAGSSMGGLISMYAICEYPKVFAGAACLSTHWIGVSPSENNPLPASFMSYLSKKLPNPKNHKLYFDYGTATIDAHYPPFQKQADEMMKSKGFSAKNWITKEFIGEEHSEKAWQKRLHIPFEFLLGL